MQLAQGRVVVVTDLAIMRQALFEKADVWSDRPLHNHFFQLIIKGEGKIAAEVTRVNHAPSVAFATRLQLRVSM